MRGDQVGEVEHHARQHDALRDKEQVRLDVDPVRLFTRAALGAGIDQRQRQHGADH